MMIALALAFIGGVIIGGSVVFYVYETLLTKVNKG